MIVLFPAVLRPALDSWFPAGDPMTGAGQSPYAFITVIFTHGFALMVMLGVPLFLGLTWNKWAGGAAGFVTGTLYYIAFAGYNIQYSIINYGSSLNLYADPSFIGNYIVCGILIGYIAGALNNKSMRIKRMLGAGLTASITIGVFQFILNITVSFAAWMTLQGNVCVCAIHDDAADGNPRNNSANHRQNFSWFGIVALLTTFPFFNFLKQELGNYSDSVFPNRHWAFY